MHFINIAEFYYELINFLFQCIHGNNLSKFKITRFDCICLISYRIKYSEYWLNMNVLIFKAVNISIDKKIFMLTFLIHS
jgi:hypothetical protein